MFENITSGWRLGSAIRRLVFKDKKLLVFPAIAGVVIVLETIAIFASFILFRSSNSIALLIGLFAYYIVVYFTSAYVLVAMLIAFRSFSSKTPIGVMDAFSKASGYTALIFEWAVFEAVVTMIIRAIEQRLGFIGSAIFGLGASIAMSVATAFAIPVIVDKRTGPVSTLKESTGFIVRNFGKTFGGLAYSELYSLMIMIVGFLVLMVGLFSFGVSFVLGAVVAVIGVLLMVFGGMLGYILSNVYRFVLYDHMNGGKLPEGITDDMVKASVKTQRQNQGGGVLGGLGGGFAGPQ